GSRLRLIPLSLSEDSPLLTLEENVEEQPERMFEHLEQRQELEALVIRLPELYRVAVACYYFENLSYQEIATQTSVRIVLLFRIMLVVGYNALLGAVASAIITAIYGGSFWEMVQLWMGPVLFLSLLSLALSMAIGSLFAILASVVFEATQ